MTNSNPERTDHRIFQFTVSDNIYLREVFVVHWNLELAREIVRKKNLGADIYYNETHDFYETNMWSVTTEQRPL